MNDETPPQTSDKAVVAAGATFVSVLLAAAGFGDMPVLSDIEAAAKVLAAAFVSGAISGGAAWFKRNRLKA